MSRARTLSQIIASVPAAVQWKLDEEIDFEHKDIRGQVIPQHLGRIADIMLDWQDAVADSLCLSVTDRNDIAERYPDKPKLQRREALSRWKSGLGRVATYRALMEVFFRAGKVDYAEFVCDLLKDDTSDLGVGSTMPTTASHAHTTSATTSTTAGHIGFTSSMGPDSLAQWLRQEYEADYPEDVEKLCKAKINGKLLLNSLSALNSKLDLSIGFQMVIEERAQQLKESSTAGAVPSNSAANLPPVRTSPSATQTQPNADFDRYEVKHHLVSRLEWADLDTGERKNVRVYNRAAWKWNNVATNLGLEPGEIQSIHRNHFSDDDRVTDVFRHWFDNANNLPNKNKYPKKWSGLIRLLNDSDLGQLSEEVKTALSATSSNVRGNL